MPDSRHPRRRRDTLSRRPARGRHNVAVSQREKRLPAVIKNLAEVEPLTAELLMPPHPVLNQRESKNQSRRPKPQQQNQRQRPEISQKTFAPVHFDPARQPDPGNPGVAVEPGCQAERALYFARKNDSFEGVQQDGEDNQNAKNDSKGVHGLRAG